MVALALWRFLQRTPWSSAMAILGVALGVTSIVSVHLISTSIALRLDALIPTQLAGYSHFLHRDELQADDYFLLRKAWRRGAAGNITRLGPLIDETVDLNGRHLRVIGVDLFAPGMAVELQQTNAPGAGFSWSGVWVDDSLEDHLQIPINGIVDAPEGTVIGDISVVQDLLKWPPGRISYVGVQFVDPWAELQKIGENLLPGFTAGLPASPPAAKDLAGWTVLSLATQHPASQFGKSVLFNISALGVLALLVAWFLMYQVAVSWLRRLWPVFQRLHVLGVDWRELRLYFVTAMCVLGVVSALAGLVGGQWLAQQLYKLAAGVEIPDLTLNAWVIMKALGSAVGVCFVGGLWAFRQARLPQSASGGRVLAAVMLLLVASFGVLEPASGLAGGFLSIAVLSMLTVLLVTPLLLRIRRFSALIGGPYLARLSLREAVWYPQDLGVALAGLTLAVATAIGVGLMIDSFREDFSRMLERRLSYDVVAVAAPEELQTLEAFAATRADVDRIQAYAEAQIRVQGVSMELVVSRIDQTEAQRYGLNRALAADEALISEQGARLLDVAVHDRLRIAGIDLVVAGVFASFGDIQPRLIVDSTHPLAERAPVHTSVSLSSSSPDQLMLALRQQFPAMKLRQQTELRRTALNTFDQTFAITTVLILIAMMVASIGVYVAVTALRLNKRTSSNLLKGMGISRFEDIGMDLALGVGIGVTAMLLAVPLGAALGWILCSVVNPRAFGWTVELQFSVQAMMTPVFWGLLAAACAGVIRIGRHKQGPDGGVG